MFQQSLRLLLAFVFFFNIFTPSLLQAQRYSKRGEERELPIGSLPTSVSRRKYQENYIIHQDNTRVKSSFPSNRNIPQKNSLQRETLSFHHDRSIDKTLDPQNTSTPQIASEIDSLYISVTNRPSHIRREQRTSPIEHQFKRKKSFAETYNLYFEYDGGGRRPDLRDNSSIDVHFMTLWDPRLYPAEEKILTHAGARNYYNKLTNPSEFSEVICNDSRLIWSAIKIINRRRKEAANYDRDQFTGKPLSFAEKQKRYQQDLWLISETAGGGAWTDGPITPQENMKAALGKHLTSEKDIVQEMFINDDLDIGWIKSFLSGERDHRILDLEYRKYFIHEHAMPDFVKKWYEGYLEEINNDSFDPRDPRHYRAFDIITRYFYRDSSETQTAEAALYFMELLDLKEYKSLTQEEQDIVHQEFLEVEEILKKRLYSINGKTWEDVNARGAIRLALWNLYKFYYLTGMKETSGMEAPLDELLKGMQIGWSYYKHDTFTFPKEHYQPAKVFPLAAEGSFGDKLCKEAIEDAKSVDGNQEVYHTALQYATLLLVQAKGNILPLMRYVDQNKESVDLTSPVVADTMVVLQTAASEAYQDPFKLALFISALRILSAPVEFSMRTRLSAVEHAYNLLSTNYNIPTALQDDKIKNFLTQNKSYFAEMIAKLYCTMLYTYKTNDEFELDSENFETVVVSLGTMYEKLFYPTGYIKATGSSLFDGPIDKERPYCKWEDAGTILKNKSIDEAMDTIATFVIDAALWIVGGWLVGVVFKGASIVIRSSWVALKTTPKALGAVNTVRKGRKIHAAVIEYKKAYRYSNYMRNVAKNSTVTQTYTRANTAARTAKGASTAQQSSRAATTVTAQGGKGATTITSQGAKGAGTATSASAGASSTASGSAAGTVGRETTRAVTKKSQLIYSDPFRNPKQLTNLTRTEYRPVTSEPLTWRLTDESLALFNAERGIRNYDILRKMRGVDQFGNTMKFFEPLPASRLFSFNPTIAQRELGVMTQYVQNGGLKELNIWGLTESGNLVQMIGPLGKPVGNPLITRFFAADQGFTKLALNNPASFMRLAASPNKPAVGLISELRLPFTSENIALSFLKKGYGLSGKNLFTKALLPTSWKTLPMAEWNYIKSSWKPTLKFFGAWEVGDIIAEPLITQWQEKTLLSLTNKAMTPYSGIFDEAGKWGKALTELNYKNGSIPPASAHLASDLADNNKDPEYLFPLLAGGIGTGLDYVDIWKDIPLIGNMTDWIGKSLMSLGQEISSVPGGEYLSLPFILTSLPFQGAEPLKMMGGIEVPQEAKDMLSEQTEHRAWKTRTDTNKIKRSYRKMAESMYENTIQVIFENVPKERRKDVQEAFGDLLAEYKRDLTEAVKKPETANDIVPITEKFNQNFWLRSHEVNFRELKNLAKENLNTKLRIPVLTKIDNAMKEIDTIRQGDSILSEAEKEEKEKQLTGIYNNAVLALREQIYIAQIMKEIENANQAYYIKFVQSSFAKVSQNIQPEKFDDYFQHLETNLANGFSILEFWVYYKEAFVTMQSQARELGNEELWGEIEQVLGKVEEYLNDPKPLTAEQQIEINNAYRTLHSKLKKSLEQNIILWEKTILADINNFGTKVQTYIVSWKNKEARKEAEAAIETFVQQATAVVKGEGLVSDKNNQLRALLSAIQKQLQKIYNEKELQQETKEELLPSSNTDLHTQAY